MVNIAHITGCGRSQASLEESLISVISGKTISNSSSSSSISPLLQSKFNTPSFFFFFFILLIQTLAIRVPVRGHSWLSS